MLEVDVAGRLGAFEIDTRFTAGRGVTVLFGRSGAGKSSVINMIAGLIRPERGRIAVDGRVLFDRANRIDLPVARRRVGYIFQEGRLLPHLTVRQNLLYGRWFAPRGANHMDLGPVVEMLGIGHLLRRRPADLSGGEKQRVAIGRALLAAPRLLLMDEPLASLDAQRKAEILPCIERLPAEAGVPIVYVSHAVEEVVRLADTLILMADGRVTAAGPVADLTSRLDLPVATDPFDRGSVIAAVVDAHRPDMHLSTLRFDGGGLVVPMLDMPLGTPARVQIRARDVALATQKPEHVSILNVLPGHVTEVGEPNGAYVEVVVAVGAAAIVARITRFSLAELHLAPGRPVFAMIKSVALGPPG